MDEKSPFKPAEVLQMHAEQQPGADAVPAVSEPACVSLTPEAPAPRVEEELPTAASRCAHYGMVMVPCRKKGRPELPRIMLRCHFTLLQHNFPWKELHPRHG